MADKLYYVHFSGENLGPIPTKLMQKLIQIGRLHGDDFAAQAGQSGWTKLCETAEFENLFASMPKAPVPAATSNIPQAAPVVSQASPVKTKAAPQAAAPVAPAPAAPAPVAPAKPQPKVEAPKPLQGVVTIGKKMFKILEVRQAGLILEASGDLDEGTEVQMQISGTSFPKPFEMKAILIGKEPYQGMQVYMTEFVRPNPAHKRLLAPFTAGSEKE
jgi:hypothetical protein